MIKPKPAKSAAIILLLEKTYLATIKNSVGSNQFKTFYALVSGQEQDILRSGKLSCAFFVSSILYNFNLIREVHTTVAGTVSDLEKSGWKKTKTPRPGSVLVWENIIYPDGESHGHLGFFIGHHQTVSNDSTTGIPALHNDTFSGTRKITAIYKHSWPAHYPRRTKTI